MRILLLTDMFPSPAAPLSGIFLFQAARQLQALGHDLFVVHPVPHLPFPLSLLASRRNPIADYPRRWSLEGIPIEFPHYWYSWKLLGARYSGPWLHLCRGGTLRRLADRFQPDIIWAQPALPIGWAAMKLADRIQRPYVLSIHGADINTTIHQPGARAKVAEVYSCAAAVTAVSNRLLDAAREVAPEANLHLIHNGFEASDLQEALAVRERYLTKRDPRTEIRVISISQLIPSKGIHFNLQALDRLKDKYPQLRYSIVGDGCERKALEALTRKSGLEDRVRFHGWQPWPEAMKLLAESDILSLPSYREGFGVVYLEAMALGLPVIGVQGQGISDLIRERENGQLTKPEDGEALVEAWEYLFADRSRQDRIGATGRTTALALTWTTAAEKYDHLFRGVFSFGKKGERRNREDR